MKKIMIASDIHGSAYYCEKMLERYRSEEADMLAIFYTMVREMTYRRNMRQRRLLQCSIR